MIHAQEAAPIPDIAQQQRRIEQNQEAQLRRIFEQADNTQRGSISPTIRPAESSLEEIFKNNASLYFHTLKIEGDSLLKKKFLAGLIGKYEKKKLNAAEVRNILREITNEYVRMGYITCRAFLPPQNILTGVLHVQVIEGTLEGYKLADPESKIKISGAFPHTVGSVVNIREIEQGLDQINRLQSNNSTMDVLPGSSSGTSEILIKNDFSKNWYVYTDVNNFGLDSTGVWQHFTTLTYDNLLQENDLISFTHGYDPTLASDGSYNQLDSLLISIPNGRKLIKLGVNYSKYRNYQNNNSVEIRSKGNSIGAAFDMDWLLFRDQTVKCYLHGGLKFKNSKNYLNELLLEISSRKTTVASLGLSAIKILDDGNSQLYANATYSHGLGLIGASGEPFLDGPDPRFHKFALSASYSTYFTKWDKSFSYQNSFNIQYSEKELFSSEQINIGGHSTVRGYRNDSVSADNGMYMRQEFSATFRDIKLSKSHSIEVIQPYLAHDIGFIFNSPETASRGIIDGVTLGSRFTHKNLRADLSLSLPISSPAIITEDDAIIGVSVSYNF